MNADFEGSCEGTGGGMGRAVLRGGPEGAADPRHPGDGGGGGGRGLKGGNLEIIPETDLICLGAAESGHPGALRSNVGLLGGVIRGDPDTIGGGDGGGGDDGAVAD